MPARVSRANTAAAPAVSKDKRRKNKRRGLDAYERAQEQVPEERSRSHRLGEIEDDGPRRKRRRDEDEDEEDEEEQEQPQRKKSAKRSDDPDVEFGSDSSGNEWTMGGIGEDDDDSDLDSDEAFGESDEERFGGFTFRGSKSSKKKKGGRKQKNVDLSEGEESEEDDGDSQDEEGLGFGDDAVDLAAMLDDDEEDEPRGKSRKADDMDEDSGSEEDDESSESESEDEEEDDGDDEERVARMRDRLEALDSSSRRTSVPQSAAAATVDDFLEDTGLDFDKPTSKKKKSQKPTTIAAPLPKRQQNKLDREVATQKAKEQLDRWRDTVARNRRAEFLSFPLQNTADQAAPTGKEKFTPANQEAPQNELEESIQRIMEESGLAAKQKQADADDGLDEETALIKAEELAEKQLPVEEVLRRRQELRRQRELLFREEIKAKRIAKIKSKSYRRVHRKERERDADREKKMLEVRGIDPMEDEDEKERADRKRAEARMGTKHKDSKWAKSLKQTNRTAWDENARDGVVQQAKRAEDLKRRIAGADVSDDEGSDSPSDGDDDLNDEDYLQKVRDADNMKPNEKKGIAGLKFMQDAEERKRKANEEDASRLRKELAIADGDEEESEAEDETLGRAIFGPQGKDKKPQPKEKKLEFEAPEERSDDEEGDQAHEQEDVKTDIVTDKPAAKEKTQPSGASKSTKPSRPLATGWLTKEPAPAKNEWLKAPKGASKSQGADQVALEVSVGDAEHGRTTKSSKSSTKTTSDPGKGSTAANTNGWTTVAHNDGSDDEEPQNAILSGKEASQTLQQRAFAGDDVEAAFEAEKADLADSEDEKEVSNHIPGWGSWAGEGLSKSIRKANARAKHNPLFKTKLAGGIKQADRKDANTDKVIISEKQDRKGKKYLAPMLPHEYETAQQYERSRRLPMGPEWTTKEVHQRMTKPKVVVKKGVNVRAIEKPVA
ncbi:hypothetical protein M409DRAFT_24158 [Zasmidium cellare ATCC 36951]|uniref:Uncharacterized protein n=1 Tax=Zasmidium cellare ATCC 36951 TaxID=1080233 RepID=A0A6A6CDK7_ZASCE|nr:uncharacterized protein M409DRAFT_24158 [Zasmidium cellare ATCC 36951]KAF2165307.1 hypothetical protein M409DRAFT_24158 [Zasmidium cellare ATCC 36951]